MTEHTPPPWQVLQTNGHLYVCALGQLLFRISGVDDTIAAANANTMAAAPELLAVVDCWRPTMMLHCI